MTLSDVLRCLTVDVRNARSPAMGAEPEVRIPLSLARAYLRGLESAQRDPDALNGRVSHMDIRVDSQRWSERQGG